MGSFPARVGWRRNEGVEEENDGVVPCGVHGKGIERKREGTKAISSF